MITRDALLELKRRIEDHYAARIKAVNLLLETLNEIERPPKRIHLVASDQLVKPRRVRGVLAAVNRLIPDLPETFDRNDVMERLREQQPALAARVTLENLRGTLRILAKQNKIELRSEATNTQPARYVVRRAA
jgi:hypothetical protein